MEAGRLVEFFEEKRIYCGFCLEDRGDRLRLLTETNREMTLSRSRLIHSSPSPLGPRLPRQQLVEHLKDVAQRREALQREINLEELWELVVGEQETYTVEELAELWFGAAVTPDQVAALGRALFADRFFFKYKGGVWMPFASETVANLQEKHRRELEREQELQTAAAWLKAAWEGQEITDPAWRNRLVARLREMAIHGPEAPHYDEGKEYLERARIFKPETPFRLLVRLGVFQEDENLDLYRLEVPQDFPVEIQSQAAAISQEGFVDPYAAQRLALTGEEIITIDGERTRDFDDALSLKRVPEGWQLGIHITDVSACIRPGDQLDLAAQERGTSIYLPDQRIPMLPEVLSENTLSLVAHQPRLALSFIVTLSETAEILKWDIVTSRIQVERQLTYSEADHLIAADPTLAALERLCTRLRDRRLAQAGINLQIPEVLVRVEADGEVSVRLEDPETPSHRIVSEAMVLANWLGARFLAERQIPAIYRGQAPPREEIVQEASASLFQLWQNRRRLSRMVLDLDPQPHWGLGLPVYTTLSSPIRRYLDLLTHRQLHAALKDGSPPYRREQLENILTVMEPALRRAGQLKTRRLRYWLLKYLSKHLGQKFPALVLERLLNRYRLLLTDLLLEVELPAPPALSLQPGEEITIRVDRVHPREDQLKVSLA